MNYLEELNRRINNLPEKERDAACRLIIKSLWDERYLLERDIRQSLEVCEIIEDCNTSKTVMERVKAERIQISIIDKLV